MTDVNITTFEGLPFVGEKTLWKTTKPEGFIEACDIGYSYARAYIQYLHDHPEEIGSNILGIIAKDIDFSDRERSGIWVGFFSELEILAARH